MGICFYLGVTLYATDALLKKKHWILMKTMNNLNFNLELTRIVHCLQIIISDISYCGIFGEHSVYLDFCIS